jgi:hypothetical protein
MPRGGLVEHKGPPPVAPGGVKGGASNSDTPPCHNRPTLGGGSSSQSEVQKIELEIAKEKLRQEKIKTELLERELARDKGTLQM